MIKTLQANIVFVFFFYLNDRKTSRMKCPIKKTNLYFLFVFLILQSHIAKLKESMTDELAIKKQGEARTVVVLSQLQKKLDQLEKDVSFFSSSFLTLRTLRFAPLPTHRRFPSPPIRSFLSSRSIDFESTVPRRRKAPRPGFSPPSLTNPTIKAKPFANGSTNPRFSLPSPILRFLTSFPRSRSVSRWRPTSRRNRRSRSFSRFRSRSKRTKSEPKPRRFCFKSETKKPRRRSPSSSKNSPTRSSSSLRSSSACSSNPTTPTASCRLCKRN